jgi:glutamate-ammonia-ligase adenylyltransferase
VNDALQNLVEGLPDADSARRFIDEFEERNRSQYARLLKDRGLLSDVLTLAAYSPFIATTLLQHPDYVAWLGRKRRESLIATKDDLLESLARFSLTHTELDTHVLLARFRRRELLRIYLRDIRRLATTAEITEEISNLADAILEYALQHAKRELDNLFGIPLETDERGRSTPSEFCIVSVGKLGSKELNYASDIDLLFIYSAEGTTSGQGSRGAITNHEYFAKLSQKVIKTVGEQSGEGAAYRVDLRLRPHGTIGPLAQSLADTVRYYHTEARRWEMQVLIRCRSSAGEAAIFNRFFSGVEDQVFSRSIPPEETLANVRMSKEGIDRENAASKGFNVKLGSGGIREIEFLAQGLQLAYGGNDRWIRAPHTLISLARLADRGYITESELTQAAAAYDFLRHLEHVLQMEHGLQTHTVPIDPQSRSLIAAKMNCETVEDFNGSLEHHTTGVHRTFDRIFNSKDVSVERSEPLPPRERLKVDAGEEEVLENEILERVAEVSPRYAAAIRADPDLERIISAPPRDLSEPRYPDAFESAIKPGDDIGQSLSALRKTWSKLFYEIVVREATVLVDASEAKHLQSLLAEASLDAAIRIAKSELEKRYRVKIDKLSFAVLALGKLGGATVDYESDLDVVFVYSGESPVAGVTEAEIFSKAAEMLITALSGMTKDGNLYRVDLRLRPYGKNGPLVISDAAFTEYIREKADIWELLAFVKIRGVAGDLELAKAVEHKVRSIIHQRALGIGRDEIRSETVRVRELLKQQRAGRRTEVDIKYGSGGMLDVYFAMRYLQLVCGVPDPEEDRSTTSMLNELHKKGCINDRQRELLVSGYKFLSMLDHDLRLAVGRVTKLPSADHTTLDAIARRMGLDNTGQLIEQLTMHRLNIRSAYDEILSINS